MQDFLLLHIPSQYKYSISQVTLVENSGNLNFKDIVSDSGKIDNDKISYYKQLFYVLHFPS